MPENADIYCFTKQILSSERINGLHEKTLGKTVRERGPSDPPKLERKAPKVGGFAANFACGFFEFWRGGSHFLIVFLKVFARRPLSRSYDKTDWA